MVKTGTIIVAAKSPSCVYLSSHSLKLVYYLLWYFIVAWRRVVWTKIWRRGVLVIIIIGIAILRVCLSLLVITVVYLVQWGDFSLSSSLPPKVKEIDPNQNKRH